MNDIYCSMCSSPEFLHKLKVVYGTDHKQISDVKYVKVTSPNTGKITLRSFCLKCYNNVMNSQASRFKIEDITKDKFIKLQLYK